MRDLTYHRPSSLDEAVHLAGMPDTALLAGGQSLLPVLRRRERSPAHLVDLRDVLSRQVEPRADGVWIGAGATHATIVTSVLVRDALPALAALAGHVGDPAVRHRGTLGGTVAANEPAGDYPAACLALDAVVHTTDRDIPAAQVFTGHRRTALTGGEIITGITFPRPDRAAYLKLLDPASRYATVGVFVALTRDGPRVAVTGARHEGATRWREPEDLLRTTFSGERLRGLTLPPHSARNTITDDGTTSTYRAHLAGVLAGRATDIANGLLPDAVSIVHGAPPSHPGGLTLREEPPR